MEVEAERSERIVTLAETEFLLHFNQPWGTLGPEVGGERGWKKQGYVDNVVIGGVRDRGELRLVHPLMFTELSKPATKERALFDHICWKVVFIVFCNECLQLYSPGGVR